AAQVRVVVVEPLVNRAPGAVAEVVVGAAGEVVAAAEPDAVAQVVGRRAEVRPGVAAAAVRVVHRLGAGLAGERQAEDQGTDTEQDLIHRKSPRVTLYFRNQVEVVRAGQGCCSLPIPVTPTRRSTGTDLRAANCTALLS